MSLKLFDMTGRVALVTGGSRGLGQSMARGLASAGADVVISGRHEATLKESAATIGAGVPGKVRYVAADMTDRADVARLAKDAVAVFGKIDVLVNNAGDNKPQAIDAVDDATWDRLMELNLSSCMALTRAVAPGMKERKWGRIVHISSIMGLVSTAGRNAYSATKSALIGLARASANDLGAYGVTVNCIAPGPFLTELPLSVISEADRNALAARTSLGRWGEPDELIGPILLLASDAGSYITGSVLLVDGGTVSKVF